MAIAVFMDQDRKAIRDKLSQTDVRREIREQVIAECTSAIPSVAIDEAVNRAFETRASVISRRCKGESCDYRFASRKSPVQGFTVQRLGRTPYPTFLGEVHISETIPPEAFGKIARVVHEYGRLFLCVKKLALVARPENQGLRLASVDPGVRTFAAAYSSDRFSEIGGGFNTAIFAILHQLDARLSQRKNLLNRCPPKRNDWSQWMSDRYRNIEKIINRLRNRASDLVSDLHKRTAHYLTESFDILLLPTFEVKQMTAKAERCLHTKTVRQMLGLGHYRFKLFVKWIARKKGKHVIDVNESYTSKTDSRDGVMVHNLGGAKIINGMVRDFNGPRGILLRAITRQLEPETTTTSAAFVADVTV